MSSPLVTQIVADALQPHPKKLDKKAHAALYPALRMVFPASRNCVKSKLNARSLRKRHSGCRGG